MGQLATKNTWFENLWHLCSNFGIKLHMAKKEAMGPVREGDVSVMAAFWDLGFRGADFQRLNRVRKFYCVAHKSDLVACDGRTVMDDLFNRTEGGIHRAQIFDQ